MQRTLSPGRRKLEEMSEEELRFTLADLRAQHTRVLTDVNLEKTKARASGRPWNLDNYPRLKQRKTQLEWLIRRVESLSSGKTHKSTSPPTEAENFMKMAKLLLEPGLFEHILQQARE